MSRIQLHAPYYFIRQFNMGTIAVVAKTSFKADEVFDNLKARVEIETFQYHVQKKETASS